MLFHNSVTDTLVLLQQERFDISNVDRGWKSQPSSQMLKQDWRCSIQPSTGRPLIPLTKTRRFLSRALKGGAVWAGVTRDASCIALPSTSATCIQQTTPGDATRDASCVQMSFTCQNTVRLSNFFLLQW